MLKHELYGKRPKINKQMTNDDKYKLFVKH